MSDHRWHHRFLERYRKRFEAGDKSVLLYCVDHCFRNDTPVPTWLKRALSNVLVAAHNCEIKSWDEAFGKPLKKGQRRATARRNAEIAYELHSRVEERHRAGEALDKALFAAVGKEFGVGGTVASELYYAIRKTLKEFDEMCGEINNFREDCK